MLLLLGKWPACYRRKKDTVARTYQYSLDVYRWFRCSSGYLDEAFRGECLLYVKAFTFFLRFSGGSRNFFLTYLLALTLFHGRGRRILGGERERRWLFSSFWRRFNRSSGLFCSRPFSLSHSLSFCFFHFTLSDLLFLSSSRFSVFLSFILPRYFLVQFCKTIF